MWQKGVSQLVLSLGYHAFVPDSMLLYPDFPELQARCLKRCVPLGTFPGKSCSFVPDIHALYPDFPDLQARWCGRGVPLGTFPGISGFLHGFLRIPGISGYSMGFSGFRLPFTMDIGISSRKYRYHTFPVNFHMGEYHISPGSRRQISANELLNSSHDLAKRPHVAFRLAGYDVSASYSCYSRYSRNQMRFLLDIRVRVTSGRESYTFLVLSGISMFL